MVETNDIEIFCPRTLRARKTRSAAQFSEYSFLHQWATRQMLDRLGDIKRAFQNVLHIGGRSGGDFKERFSNLIIQDEVEAFAPDVVADAQFMPYAPGSFDLILSTLDLHTINDLPGSLLQIRKTLKPDGLFMAALFGGESLHQLRQSLTEAELSLKGGISPRVSPFADKQQMGGLLQRAGFSLPVVDSEIITVTYENMFKLMRDLRGMGESNAIAKRSRANPGKALFFEAARQYQEKYAEEDGRIPAHFEIIFLLGWCPHSSQQQPLKPGSADIRLADALRTEEIKTP